MIHNRFPELRDARAAFLGADAQTNRIKQTHAADLVEFSNTV